MQRILERRNLSCLIHFPISSSAAETLKLLDQMIQAARVVHMDKVCVTHHLSADTIKKALDFLLL